MTQEEKAKAYDKAIAKSVEFLSLCKKCGAKDTVDFLESIFPELAESEDEKIRKELTEFLKSASGGFLDTTTQCKTFGKWVAWLEKQGQKPFDHENTTIVQNESPRIESKFNIGDWILIDNPCQIESIDSNGNYIVKYCGAEETHLLSRNFCNSHFHLWTIQDAKEGDVLVASDDSLFIFAKVKDNSAYYYFSLCTNGSKEISDGNHAWETASSCHPATKEQRDTLMKAMTDAGWEFDFEKKELKKISQRMVSAEAKEALYDKPAWSEEDEEVLRTIISDGLRGAEFDMLQINWLKSLKDRVQPQSKQEWSEDDVYNSKLILATVSQDQDLSLETKDKLTSWFKSLKPQNHWKPSDEQIKVCKEVYADILSTKGFDLGTINDELNRLEEELKKLK